MTAPILTTGQVAARLHRPVRTIRDWCERGDVFPGAFQVGNRWVIPLRAVLLREGTEQETA